jgi:phosphate transport system substrate-binding protein
MRMRNKMLLLVTGALAVSMVAAACSKSTDSNNSGDGGGSLKISGSSTVEPITSLVAEKFNAQNPDVQVAVDGPGTTDGFQLFCKGQTDINDASRQITDDEKALCTSSGVDYVELPVGRDALTVVGNPADSLTCLSFSDLYALFGPESAHFANWSDANALDRKVGGKGSFPDEPLTIVAPGEESGTYGSFIDLAIKSIAEDRGQATDQLRPDYQASGDDNVIVDNAEGTKGGLGFVGFSYAQNAGANVKEYQVDGGSGCVAPSAEAVINNTYPLSRTLYIYVSKEKLADNPSLNAFVDLYLSDDGIASVTDVKYIALPSAELEDARTTWRSASS